MEHMYRDLEASKQICRNGYQEPCGSTHEARQTGFEASISSFAYGLCPRGPQETESWCRLVILSCLG